MRTHLFFMKYNLSFVTRYIVQNVIKHSMIYPKNGDWVAKVEV
ncbi:hypothetical protein EVA_15310 [gut metagenome]|uniref:Uncharacterized protein n=1 Tax=gut metagenome TaxID=749906 RepID=J9FQ41_9ZZZZ